MKFREAGLGEVLGGGTGNLGMSPGMSQKQIVASNVSATPGSRSFPGVLSAIIDRTMPLHGQLRCKQSCVESISTARKEVISRSAPCNT